MIVNATQYGEEAQRGVKVNKFDANCHSGKHKDFPVNQSKEIFPKNIFEIVIKPDIVVFYLQIRELVFV
jgi:hypothetical protein